MKKLVFLSLIGIVAADMMFFPAVDAQVDASQHHSHHSANPKPIPMENIRFKDAFSFVASKGEKAYITYTLPESALVTIRVKRKGTRELFLNTIVNSEYREAGAHTEMWDGRDYGGNIIEFSKTPYEYLMEAESTTASSPHGEFKGIEYEEGISQKEVIERTNFKRHIHGLHKQEYENIPLLTITSPKSNQILKGKVVIRSFVDEKRRGYGDRYGYGVRYYIDDDLVHEEFYKPESRGNFSYELDTTAFEDGKHLFYIGLCDHNDHVTSQSLEIIINNSEQ